MTMKAIEKWAPHTYCFVALMILLSIDRWSKQMAVLYLKGQEDISLIDGVLELHYLENAGAAFGILQGHMGLFYLLTILICIGILVIYRNMPMERRFHPLRIDLVVLLAGALGNLYDRVMQSYVVDFIYLSIIHFPIFNVADIYVTCSVAVLFVLLLFVYKEEDLDRINRRIKNVH